MLFYPLANRVSVPFLSFHSFANQFMISICQITILHLLYNLYFPKAHQVSVVSISLCYSTKDFCDISSARTQWTTDIEIAWLLPLPCSTFCILSLLSLLIQDTLSITISQLLTTNICSIVTNLVLFKKKEMTFVWHWLFHRLFDICLLVFSGKLPFVFCICCIFVSYAEELV